MNDRFTLFLLLFAAFSFTRLPSAKAQYVQTGKVFSTGQTINISVTNAKKLLITYRPGSNISKTQTIELTGTSYSWTPKTAGIFSFSTPGGPSQTVSVSFGHFPLSGLIIFIIAGTILFGGATYAAVNLFGGSPAKAI